MILHIQNASTIKTLPQYHLIHHWALHALGKQYNNTELTLRIVDEEESQALNKQWRHKDNATNVLSFTANLYIEQALYLLGDIVICAAIVEKEARQQGKTCESHWAHLVIHGILHLQGYDHLHKNDADIMEAREITILNNLGYPNPYELEISG